MMMYHQIKFGCRKKTSSVDMVELLISWCFVPSQPQMITSGLDMVETVILDYMSHHYDPEFENSKQIFLHDTLAHDDVSPYQAWLQTVQQLRRNCPDEHLLEF